jgi:hypothetical protein
MKKQDLLLNNDLNFEIYSIIFYHITFFAFQNIFNYEKE